MVFTSVIHVITRITTNLPTLEGWKAEMAWLVDPQRTFYQIPTRDHVKEIPSAKDRRPNH